MPSSAPAYTIGGITRPALIFDNAGNIILTPEAAAFAAAYGTKALYFGLPANTPFPPVAPTLSTPADANAGANSVLENATTNTAVGLTVQATNIGGPPVTYSLSNDAGGRFQINATTGVVTVANGSLLDYETATGHAYNITVQATDGILSTSQTFAIGVGNVNEAPAGTNGTVTASEDTNRVFTAADFGFTDPADGSAPNALAAVRIATLPATGQLLNNGVPVNAGDFISAAAIAAGQLVYVPTPNTSGAGYASFTFQVRDNGGTANGGVDLDATPNTITINVNAVNDAPTATNLSQSITITEDAAATTLFTLPPVTADIDSSTVTATLTLNASAGVLVGAGAGVLSAGVLTYTISGTAAAVNAALAAVTYDSAANFNGTTSVGITIGDGANGPQGTNPTGTVSITVLAVNDAPAATNLTQSLTIGEDAAATTLFTLPPVTSDVDSATVTATLTLDASTGVLNGAGAGVLAAGVLTYTITGTAAAVNAALAAVTYDSANNFNGPTSVGVTIDDGATGPQGTNPTGTISITVNAVNDAPTATNLTQSLTIGEDAAAATLFTLAPVVTDIDSASVTATLTLDATAGVLTGAGAGVLAAGVLTYTITGTPAAVSTALAGVAFDSASDFNGITDVGITIDDGANGPQGSNPIGTGTVTINAVNDAPTATNLTQSLSVGEDGAAATLFTLAPVVADIDSSNVTATLTLDAAAGVLTGAGAGVLTAGVLTYTITGTAAAVNAALAAVTYDSAANFNGPTSVGVTIDDGGNGPQGTNPTGTISITVNAVNDAPTATNLSQSITINEDAAATTLFTLPPVTADIDSASVTATLTLDAAAGVLNGAGAGVLAAGVLTYTITGTPAAVNAALAAVTYDSAPDFFGSSNVGVTIDDGVNGPQGANPTGSIGITVNPVNDAPTVAATANNPSYIPGADLFSGVTASTVESGQVIGQIVLTVTNISDTDESLVIDGDTVALVDGTVSGAPTATLGVSYSVAVSGGTATITITSPGLTGAQTGTLIDGLTYTNTTVAPGELSRVVTIVSLTDDGGTLLGGVATGTPGIASTVNFNIAPTIDVDDTFVNYVENAGPTLIDTTITIVDADDTHMEGATVAITSGYVSGDDVLTFTGVGAITGNFVGGTLTLTGTGTIAEYEQVLESVRYQNISNDPVDGDRIVTYTVNDGFVNGPSDTATVHVAARNDEPTLTATAANPGFTENGAAVDLFSSPAISTVEAGQTLDQIIITVTNVAGTGATESLLIDGTTVELNNGNSEVTATNGMTASVVLAGGTATVTISRASGISAADMTTLVDALAYGNTSEDPGNANRVVTVTTLRDDGLNGGGHDNINATLAVASTVTITPVNDEPTLTTTGLNPGFTENGAAVDLFSTPVVASAIEAGQNLNTLVLTVSNVAGTGATENLTIDGTIVELTNGNSEVTATNGMTASVVLAGGIATVTISKVGGVSASIMQSVVDGLAYDNTSDDPGAATRVVALTSLSDTGGTLNGGDDTVALTVDSDVAVTPVNDAPVIDLVAGGGVDNTAATATFSEGAGPPSTTVLALPNLDLTDVDSANLTGATVTVTDFVGGQDVLTVSGNTSGSIGGVSYSVSGNVITFSGTASAAAYETAIQAVQYNNTSENPAPGARHFDIQVTDGTDASVTATATVNVVGQDDAPVNTIPADSAVPTAFSYTNTPISGISIADVDAGSGIVTTQLSVTNGVIEVTLAGGTTISAGANATGTLTLSGTVAAINATLGNDVTFRSNDGFSGQADLTVVTHDGGNSGLGGPLTDTDTVHIGVVPQVWYIDNTNFAADGAGGTGTVADPFRSIADFNDSAGPGLNDYIVVRTGTGTYTGEGLDLQDGQQVWGAGETLSFINPVNNAVVNIPNAGTRPTISVNGGDQGIDLAANNTIRNVNISTASGASGLDDGNNSVGTLVIRNMDISGAGQAIDIDQGGTLDVQLGSVSSSGGTHGIQLAGTAAAGAGLLSGSFSATGGAISGSGTAGFMVGNGGGASTGGTASITYGGSLTASNAARVVDVQDHATGAVTFSGNLTHSGSGAGIILDDNSSNFTFSGANLNLNTGTSDGIRITDQTGGTTVAFSGTVNIDTTLGIGVAFGGTSAANLNFTGGNLTIDTAGGQGFVTSATTNSTVNVTGSGNHINSGTGTALDITNTTIGASNVTFQDISSSGAVNGIILNNTGSSGHLNVTGTGTTDGSGGTIQNATGNGISLTNTKDVSLSNMNISGSGDDGINGNTVNGFTLANVNITNNGNAVGDRGIDMLQLSGSGGISNSTISGSGETNVRIENDTANLTAFNVTGTTIATTNFTNGDDGFLVLNTGSANMTVSVTGSTFTDNRGDHFQAASDADATGTMNITFNNNTLTTTAGNDPSVLGGGITVNTSGSLDIAFQINNNNIQQAFDDAININLDPGSLAGASMTGTISGNTIGTSGVAASGSESSNAVTIAAKGQGLLDVDVLNNNIFEWGNQYGIFVGTSEGDADVVAKVTGNILHATQPNVLLINGIRVDAGATAGDGGVLEIVLTGNDVTGEGNVSNGDADIRLRQRFETTIKLPGYAGANSDTAAVNAFVAANNDPAGATPAPTVSSAHNVGGGGGGFTGGVATPLHAAGGGVQASSPTPGVTQLTQTQLDSAVDAALAKWALAGASAAQLAKLSAIIFTVDDLAGNTIGEHSDGHVTIDRNAAGHGWFVDTTPLDNFEFAHAGNAAGTDLSADTTSAAAGHIDLLTAVVHEMGHELGLAHSADAGDVMADTLVDGERRLPDAADVAQANADQVAAAPAVTTTQGFGSLLSDAIHAGLGSIMSGLGGADNFVFAKSEAVASAPLTHLADHSFLSDNGFNFSWPASAFHAPAATGTPFAHAMGDFNDAFAALQGNTNTPWGGLMSSASPGQFGAHAGDDVGALMDSHGASYLALFHLGLLA